MKKLICALLVSFTALQAASVSVPMGSWSIPAAALTDIEQFRFLQRASGNALGTVSIPISSGDTTINVTGVCPAANVAIYIDSEPMLVTAGVGTTICTVTRNSALAAANTVAAAHLLGAQIYQLQFPNALALLKNVVQSYFQQTIIPTLGANSAVIGTAQGSISSAQAALAAALTAATVQ